MSKTPEGKVKAEIDAYLRSLGDDCWWFKPHSGGYGRMGVPDYIGCYKGWLFAIEAKAPGKMATLTPWQARECTSIERAGGYVTVADDVSIVKHMFENYFRAV